MAEQSGTWEEKTGSLLTAINAHLKPIAPGADTADVAIVGDDDKDKDSAKWIWIGGGAVAVAVVAFILLKPSTRRRRRRRY